jgi:hypothetical protein
MPILPFVTAFLLFRLFRAHNDFIEAFVRAAVVWGMLLLVLTEVLSAFHLLTFVGVSSSWALIILALGPASWRGRWVPHPPYTPLELQRWVIPPLVATLGVTLLIALVAPPNTTDAMTYHLARVLQWRQRASVEPYATTVIRQIAFAPWSEYLLLHLLLLARGGDRLVTLIAWLAFLGCLVMAVGITAQLKGSKAAASLVVLLTGTLPMGIVQASSAQTDLIVAFWCSVFAWAVLTTRHGRRITGVLVTGSAFGLAIATKGTAYVICAPFAVWWLASRLRIVGWRRTVIHGVALGAVALIPSAPHFARNIHVFQHPLGPARMRAEHSNATHGVGSLISNLIRNSTVHLGTPSGAWNRGLARAVERAHQVVGLDAQDPRTTWSGYRYDVWPLSTHESEAGNALHFLLIIGTTVLLWIRPAPAVRRRYLLAVLAGSVLFCFAFRWQPWNSRLHTPLFILAMPLVAIAVTSITTARQRFGLGLLLWVAALPWLVANRTRPLVTVSRWGNASIWTTPRERQYFADHPSFWRPYALAMNDLGRVGCTVLGVSSDEDAWTYPLLPMARSRGVDLRVQFAFVENETREFGGKDSPPCALLAVYRPPDWRPPAQYQTWRLVWRESRVGLWLPLDSTRLR